MAEKKKKQPESATAVSNKCEFCKKIGSYYTVCHHHEQATPKEFKKFKVLYDGGFNFSLICCRICKTVYKRRRYVDNEIGSGSDNDEYTEMSGEKLVETLRFYKDQHNEFKSKVHRLLRVKISSLSKDERAVINIFIKSHIYWLLISELREKAGRPLKAVLTEVLAGLVEKGVLQGGGFIPESQYSLPDWN